jgi:hypothetical protein
MGRGADGRAAPNPHDRSSTWCGDVVCCRKQRGYLLLLINITSTAPMVSPKRSGRLLRADTIPRLINLPWASADNQSRYQMRREARLRPEYAPVYPTLTPDVWQGAAMLSELLAALRQPNAPRDAVLQDRVLPDAHFEFRGGLPRSTPNRRNADADATV